MTDRFTIQVNDSELQAALSRAAAKMQDPQLLLEMIGAVIERRVNQRFDVKRDPDGAPWAPLTGATQLLYAKADGDRRQGTLLERTGRMRASLESNVVGDAVEIGFAVPYAAYHETGTKTKTGKQKMVRRGMLTGDPESGRLGDGDRQAVLQLLQRYLDGLFD